MNTKRVVVTGVGAITPLGASVSLTWEGVKQGKSGIDHITKFDASEFRCRIGGEVRDFEAKAYLEPKEIKRTDPFTQYSIAASLMAVEDARFTIGETNEHRVGVVIGTAFAGIHTVEQYHTVLLKQGHKKVTPFFIPMLVGNLAPGKVAIITGAKGPNVCVETACAAGTHAIGDGFRMIQRGSADCVITGGTDAAITPLIIGGFGNMKAVSKRNDAPQKASVLLTRTVMDLLWLRVRELLFLKIWKKRRSEAPGFTRR